MEIKNMPKLESPFVRKMVENNYLVTNEIVKGMEWVFEDESVMAIEKLHGTNVSIVIQEGVVTQIYNRTERIQFINKNKRWITEGILTSKGKGYLEFLGDGQHFGELIGPKVNANPYKLTEHIWIPFTAYAQKHLRYKSWGKYPKDFETISEWFKELMPLFTMKRGDKEGFVEGVVFTHPDGRMAKLRKDMFSWYGGKRHEKYI
ncbi:MAG: RNA ligase family protein [Candidatus Woesearchaeota archaeon]